MKCNLLHHYWTTTIGKAFTQKGTRPLHSGCARHRYIPIFQWDSRRLRDHRIHCIRTTPDAAARRDRKAQLGVFIWPPTYDMTSRPRAGDDVKYNCWTKTESEPDARDAMPLPCQLHRVMFYGLCTFVCPTRYNIRTICE